MAQNERPELIEPLPSSLADFPESTISSEGIKTIPSDPDERLCTLHLGIEYAQKSTMPLHLNIVEPVLHEGESKRFPLVMFIQGSAWFKQDIDSFITQLARFARRGFVVASVEYRSAPIAPFPAQIKDVKTALRYMKTKADDYHIDPEHIILWGTSSGGHSAVMAGMTLGNQALDDESTEKDPISVKAIIDYYGPTDISRMNEEPSTMDHIKPDSPEGMLIGGHNVLENLAKVKPTIPMNYIAEGEDIPPILIFHGNKDRLVPFGQSVMLFEALKRADKEVELYQMKGAGHGGAPFWSGPVLDIIEEFIQKHR